MRSKIGPFRVPSGIHARPAIERMSMTSPESSAEREFARTLAPRHRFYDRITFECVSRLFHLESFRIPKIVQIQKIKGTPTNLVVISGNLPFIPVAIKVLACLCERHSEREKTEVRDEYGNRHAKRIAALENHFVRIYFVRR